MTNFNEAEHPRAAAGQFTEKTQNTPEVALGAASASDARARLLAADEARRQADTEMRAAAVEVLQEDLLKEFPTGQTVLLYRPYDTYFGQYGLLAVFDGDGRTLFDADEGDEEEGDYRSTLAHLGEDPSGLDEPTDHKLHDTMHGDFRQLSLIETTPEVTA